MLNLFDQPIKKNNYEKETLTIPVRINSRALLYAFYRFHRL